MQYKFLLDSIKDILIDIFFAYLICAEDMLTRILYAPKTEEVLSG